MFLTMAKGKGLQDYEFLKCEDGIYFGRPLKNGGISADSRKITDEEVLYLVSEFIEGYCLKTGKPIELQRDGKTFIRATIVL